MKEHPILFAAPMVRAILAGTKTQTRRASKLPNSGPWEFDHVQDGYPDGQARFVFYYDGEEPAGFCCPYGGPGDRLWVRETWAAPWGKDYKLPDGGPAIFYRADGETHPDDGPWRPSIFMPRWASRITLAVESMRVERLHTITDADIAAEGVTAALRREMGLQVSDDTSPRELWRLGWSHINGSESWDANPFVWVIGFSRVTP